MAVITSATVVYQSSDPGVRTVLFVIRKVNTGDTYDVGQAPLSLFSSVYQATHVCQSNRAQGAAQPTVAGTVLTFTQAGLVNDAIEVLVTGEAPQ